MKRRRVNGLLWRASLFVVLAVFVVVGVLLAKDNSAEAAGGTVTFGVVGDHGDGSDPGATAVFKAIGAANLDFFQSAGDLSYNSNANVPTWCQFVKDTINVGAGNTAGNSYGENFPFMLATGNHETNEQSNGSDIDTFTQCLPNQLSSQTTLSANVGSGSAGSNYAKEYYYDYPATTPLARVIVAGPAIEFNANGTYTYTAGNAHYNWLSDAIDSARSSGIKWVIVVNHKNYITAGSKSNEIGSDFFNLLVSKKVDLIVQGHEHDYQRSKQLALGTGCTTVPTGTSNQSCIVDSDDDMVKDAGTVLLINGLGGHSEYNVSTSNSEAGYFAKLMGANSSNATYGFTKLTLTDTALTATFVPGVGETGGFTDSFTISSQTTGTTDTTAPTVSLTSPADGATLTASTQLAATASDAVGVTKVEFYSGTTKLGESTTSPYGLTIDPTYWLAGSYQLTAKAYDAAGNVGTSSVVNITVPAVTGLKTFTVTGSESQVAFAVAGACSNSVTNSSSATAPASLSNNKSVLVGAQFTVNCGTAGSDSTVVVSLGKKYDISKLQAYKQTGQAVSEITSNVTFMDVTVGSTTVTTVSYVIKDGGFGDSDGTANSAIVDPVFVTLASASTTSTGGTSTGATTGAGASTKLAVTGTTIWLSVAAGIAAVIGGTYFVRRHLSRR